MFESKQEISDAVAKCIEHLNGLARGDVVSLDEVETITGIKRYSSSWSTIIKKVYRLVLRDRGIAWWPLDVGSRKLLTNQEQVKVIGESRHRRMYRQAKRGLREIGAADVSALSVHDRHLRQSQLERLKHEAKQARASVKEVIRKTETIPRRVPVSA